MPDSKPTAYFFTDLNTVTQLASQSFGPVSPTEFRLTNEFTATGNAYAICKGVVLLQPQDGDINKVNLILRPYTQPFPGLNIKYFIYRGLKTSDFILDGNIISEGSDFITKINTDYDAFYSDNGNGGAITPKPAFSAKFIGYDDFPPETPLSGFFFKESDFVVAGAAFDPTDAFELPMIDKGKSLGSFSGTECGIDVVLNYGDYQHEFDNGEFTFNLAYARAKNASITLNGTDTDYQKKLKREQITQFIDISAFYGLFATDKSVDTKGGIKTGNEIYNNIQSSFVNKNNWYIYIQSDRTRSYNFYENYIIEGTANSLKYGTTEAAIAEKSYGTNDWPLLIDTQSNAVASGPTDQTNSLFLQLVTDNNNDTMLFAQTGEIANAQQENFSNADDLRLPPDAEGNYSKLTKILQLTSPSINDSGQIKNKASITLLLYQGVDYTYLAGETLNDDGQPITNYSKPNFFDDVFDLINSKPLLQTGANTIFSKMSSEKLKLINNYFDKKQQGISAVQTVTINDSIVTGDEANPNLARVTYVTEAVHIMNNPTAVTGSRTADTKTTASANGTVGKDTAYSLPDPYYYNLKLFTDSTQTITGLELKTTDDSIPDKIILGLTKEENDLLKALIPIISASDVDLIKNPRLFLIDLFDDENELISPENIKYQKYKAGIVAENNEGKLKLFMPSTDIMVYSIDRKYHFTKGYSEYIHNDLRVNQDYLIVNDIEA